MKMRSGTSRIACGVSVVVLALLCVMAIGERTTTPSTKVDTVVALMLENRSFDHILGMLSEIDRSIEGCRIDSGRECQCPLDPLNPAFTTCTPFEPLQSRSSCLLTAESNPSNPSNPSIPST